MKRDSEWLGLDETRASARPEKVARVAGDAGGDTWPKGDSQTARLLAEHHGADRESFQPDWGASRGKAGEVNASRREEEEASASRCQVLAEPVEKTSRVQEQQMSMKEEEVLKPRSPGEALGKAGVGSGPEESRGDRDDEDVPLKMLKALRSRTAADEAGAGRGPALESKQGGNGERGESPKSTLLKSTPQKERKLGVGRTGLNEQNGPGAAILHASQMKPLPSAPEELPPVALATDVIEQPVARGHVAEPSPEPDVLIEDVVIAERPGGKGASRDGRSCALCGVGPSRARGEWYCATCGTRDEACACTRPLRAHVK